jgi:hypothetical protein
MTELHDIGWAVKQLKDGRTVRRREWKWGTCIALMPELQLPPYNTQDTEPKVRLTTRPQDLSVKMNRSIVARTSHASTSERSVARLGLYARRLARYRLGERMKRWEYTPSPSSAGATARRCAVRPRPLDAVLNVYGAEGWEVWQPDGSIISHVVLDGYHQRDLA